MPSSQPNNLWHHLLRTGCLCALAAMPGASRLSAQASFVAIPTNRAAAYHIDFKIFYSSPDGEVADRKRSYALLGQLKRLTGKVASSPETLLEALRLNETVTSRFNRHIIYRQLLASVNVSDAASRQQRTALQADLDAGVAFLRPELVVIDDARLRSYMARKPALAAFAFVIERARRDRPHTLSAPEEKILARLKAVSADWPAQLYQQGVARANTGTIDVAGTPTSFASLANHPDPAVREAAWRRRNAEYESQRDVLALAIINLAVGRNEQSALRGYRNAVDQAYDELFLTRDGVTRLYDRLLSKGAIYQRYQRVIAEHIAKTSGLLGLAVWNDGLANPNTQGTRFAIDEATRLMNESLAPLGPDVQAPMANILDPKNGRLDIAGGPGRAPGAFAWGVPGLMTTFVYQSNYQGTYRDLTTLFHEASHAIHGQLLGENKELVSANMGPPYFSEGFAMFFELLLSDHMLKTETDSARRTFLLEQFLWRTMLTFNLVRQAALEQAIYDGAQAGRINDANDLDSLTMTVGRPVSIWYDRHPELRNEWSMVPHYVGSPLYMPNFIYASMLGLKLFQQYTANPQVFVPRFLALMKGGFPAAPAELLKRHLDIDLDDPRVVDDVMTLLVARLSELEGAYGVR
jgi:oligoendopeptidase F